MKLKNPILLGFGISGKENYRIANDYFSGAIIGSAFIKTLSREGDINTKVEDFINSLKQEA